MYLDSVETDTRGGDIKIMPYCMPEGSINLIARRQEESPLVEKHNIV